jgi:protocatechuate 3,4-dioxygenase beta subunit
MKEPAMQKKTKTDKLVRRREALQGLGALAVSAPAFAAIGCSDTAPEQTDGQTVAGSAAPNAGSSSAGTRAATNGTAGGGVASGQPSVAGRSPQPAAAGASVGVAAPATAGSGGAGTAGAAGESAHARAGAGGTSQAGSGGNVSGAPAAGGGDAAGDEPTFDTAASCTLTTTDIEGPFYIDEGEFPDDPSMIRSDIRESMAGCEFRLHFRMLDAKSQCAPIAGAELYIWHCNASGLYSGFEGQDPTKPYMGPSDATPANMERFCRGIQRSGSDGVASFITLYPGWYAGRPIHVHLMARMPGATKRLITTQLYFPAAFTKEVHSAEPAYMARSANIPSGSLNPPSGKPAIPTLTHMPGLVVGTLNVIVNQA